MPVDPSPEKAEPTKQVLEPPKITFTTRSAKVKSIFDDDDDDDISFEPPPVPASAQTVMEIDPPQPTQASTQASQPRWTATRRKRGNLWDSSDDEESAGQPQKKARLEPKEPSPEIQSYQPAPFASSLLELGDEKPPESQLIPPFPSRAKAVPTPEPKATASRKRKARAVLSDVEEEDSQPAPRKKKKDEDVSTSKTQRERHRKGSKEDEGKSDEAQFITVNKGRRKVSEIDKELDEEFNSLKITRPRLSDAPKPKQAVKIGWADEPLNDSQRKELEGWKDDSAISNFVIRFVPMLPPKRVQPRIATAVEEQWKGRPDFKKFIPKNSSKVNEATKKVQLSFVPNPDYEPSTAPAQHPFTQSRSQGLKPQRGGKGKAKETFAYDSQTMDEMSEEEPAPKRKGRTTAKASAPPKKLKQQTLTAMLEDSEEDEDAFTGFTRKRKRGSP
ncbi:hypothetical protein BT69DRAFT_638789 [Atractiella rhizophila]|nr:hypothetical protein BT69DRAFT_638789 [Atractiella rhizophila]